MADSRLREVTNEAAADDGLAAQPADLEFSISIY
jgi:hypothetical protein